MYAAGRIAGFLNKRKDEGIFRRLSHLPNGVDLSSNDYLGLSRSAWVEQHTATAMEALKHVPQGATASRLLNGNTIQAEQLEAELATFYRAEAALLFNSGYDANLGLIASLARPGDLLFIDESAHASIHQGAKLSGATIQLFPHNDVSALEKMLWGAKQDAMKWVVTESVFSMDGDRAPLSELGEICRKYHAALLVDEAHATGVFGTLGRGLCEENDIADICFARVFTFGKAIGAHGAVVVGSQLLKDHLINFAKPFIYSTALPLHTLVRIQMSYRFLLMSDRQQKKLLALIDHFLAIIGAFTFPVVGSGPIFGLIFPGNDKVKKVASILQQAGFDVRPIVSPTVPKGTERIRISLHSFNTHAELDALKAILVEQNI